MATALSGALKSMHSFVVSKMPDEFASSISSLFYPLFTFTVVMPVQLLYVVSVLSSGRPGLFAQFHIAFILFGAAAFRILIGFVIFGDVIQVGETFEDKAAQLCDSYQPASGANRATMSTAPPPAPAPAASPKSTVNPPAMAKPSTAKAASVAGAESAAASSAPPVSDVEAPNSGQAD